METQPATVRLALLVNAAFSLLNGLVLSLAPGRVADWLGVSVDGWLRLFGIALLGHAAALAWAAQHEARDRWTRLNLMMIAPYPLLMVLIVAAGWVDRPLGQGLVLADGAVMTVIAVLHAIGLRIGRPKAHAQLA